MNKQILYCSIITLDIIMNNINEENACSEIFISLQILTSKFNIELLNIKLNNLKNRMNKDRVKKTN